MTSRQCSFLFIGFAILSCCLLSGCTVYTLKSYGISNEVSSYYVGQFKVTAYNAPTTINQTFTEALKDKISRESRLKYNDLEPDLEFSGTVQSFDVTAVAPQPGEQTAFNRLTIRLNIDYLNHKDAKDHWTKSFSHFADFGSAQNLLQVQDQLIDEIFKQILEDVFNEAFNNW